MVTKSDRLPARPEGERRSRGNRAALVRGIAGPLVFLVLLVTRVGAAVQVDAEAFPGTVEIGDMARLRVTVSGAVQIDEPPTIAPVEGLSFSRSGQSTQVSIVNGKMTRSIVYDFVVRTQKTGDFAIGPIEIRDGGKLIRGAQVTLHVVAANAATPGGGQSGTPTTPPDDSRPESAVGGAVFVRAEVDDGEVYLGEQVTLRFQFYQQIAYPVLETRLESPPTTEGFLRQDVPPQRTRRTTVEGKPYQVTELVYALFPTQEGEFQIGPGVITCIVRETNRRRRDPFSMFGMFDDREVTIRSRPLTVRVNRLPKPEPEDFTGGVGRFKMRSSIDRTEVAQGEPITLSVRIEGTGNVPSVGMPPLPDVAPQFRSFAPSAPAYEPTRDGDLLGGSSEFSVVLVPETTGRLVIPPIQVSVFRPNNGRYEQLATDSLFVDVTPGVAGGAGGFAGEVTRTGWDLRTIRTEARLEPTGEGELWSHPRFWVWQGLPMVLLGAAWLVRRRQSVTRRNFSQIQGRRAPGRLRRALLELTKSRATIGVSEGYSRLEAALASYLDDRFGFSLVGRQREELRESLSGRGVDETTVTRLLAVLDRCDFARFAPGAADGSGLEELLEETRSVLEEIEKKRPATGPVPASKASSIGVMLLALLAGGGLARAELTVEALNPAQAEALFVEGNLAYEKQDYRTAIDRYGTILERGYQSPTLLLNLGNAYFRAGRIGWAVYAFERGRRLDPRDPDLGANLELALRSSEDRAQEPDQSRFLALLGRLQDRLPLSGSIWASSVLWWLLAVWLAIRIAVRFRRRMEWVGLALGALLVGSLAWTVVQVIQFRTRPNAVIVVDALPVRSNPDAGATVEFTLHGGTLLRTGRVAPGFREVLFSDELHGWAEESGVASF